MLKYFILLATLFTHQLQAKSLKLTSSLNIKSLDRGVLIQEFRLPVGAVVKVDRRDRLGRHDLEKESGEISLSKRGWVKVTRVRHIGDLESRRVRRAAKRLNRTADMREYFISEAVFQLSRPYRSRGNSLGPRPRRRPVERPIDEPRFDPRPDHFDSYNVCYSNPYSRWSRMKEKQLRKARTMTGVGIGVSIVGSILSGSNRRGTSNFGRALTFGGVLVTTIGLVEWANAESMMTDPRCRGFYRLDPYVSRTRIRGRSCVTRRYYSRDWNHDVEYFETRCSGSTYYTFERHSDIWYY